MGLRCLIGHEYGEPRTSRDRTERGNEVVVTVREYRECTRCGHRRVISENKEVTADAGEAADEAAAEASWAPDAEPGEDQSTVEAFTRSSAAPAGAGQHEPMTAEEDDGVILEDEPEAPPRAHGEWPAADLGEADAGDSGPEPWPDEGEATPEPDEPAEPEPPVEDPLDVGPEPSGETTAAAEASDDVEAGGTASSRPPPRPDNRNTEFVCPDCGETWRTRNPSLRPGDICPECRRGYLDERVVQ